MMQYAPIERHDALRVADLVLAGLHAVMRSLEGPDRDPRTTATLAAGVRDAIADAIATSSPDPTGRETGISRESMRFMTRDAIRRTAALKHRIIPPETPYDGKRAARCLAATFIDMNVMLDSPTLAKPLRAMTDVRVAP